jgi:hypothetical protein
MSILCIESNFDGEYLLSSIGSVNASDEKIIFLLIFFL